MNIHTPGPWLADNGGDAFYGIFGPDGAALAYLLDVAPGMKWESAVLPAEPAVTMRERFAIHEANANLMASAPDFVAALRAIVAFVATAKIRPEVKMMISNLATNALAKAGCSTAQRRDEHG